MKTLILLPIFVVSCTAPKQVKVVVSIKDQRAKIVDVNTNRSIKTFVVSTGAGGVGNKPGSKQTPLGSFNIVKEVGEGMPPTIGIKGDTITKNIRGTDPIVSRSLWIDGLNPWNSNTLNRLVRLDGSPHISTMGKPTSLGCVRFTPEDIITVCNYVQPGDKVEINY